MLGFRGKRDVEKPAGEWNRMEVICDGDTITNIVNGYVVNVGTKSSLTEGKIHVPVRRGRDPLPQDRDPAAPEVNQGPPPIPSEHGRRHRMVVMALSLSSRRPKRP